MCIVIAGEGHKLIFYALVIGETLLGQYIMLMHPSSDIYSF